MRLPVRVNVTNINAVLEVVVEAFQIITITLQILPQRAAAAAYSVSSQYETAVSFLRLPDVDWWSLYWKLSLVIAFSLLSSLVFVEVSLPLQPRFALLTAAQKANKCCERASTEDSLVSSSLYRAALFFVSNTMMMSVVQSLASVLICNSTTHTLEIDASVACWSGFHRSVAVLSMCVRCSPALAASQAAQVFACLFRPRRRHIRVRCNALRPIECMKPPCSAQIRHGDHRAFRRSRRGVECVVQSGAASCRALAFCHASARL